MLSQWVFPARLGCSSLWPQTPLSDVLSEPACSVVSKGLGGAGEACALPLKINRGRPRIAQNFSDLQVVIEVGFTGIVCVKLPECYGHLAPSRDSVGGKCFY